MNKFILFGLLLLSGIMAAGCASTATVATAPVEQARPTFQFQAPAKQLLAPVAWDWPRLADYATVKNSRKCIDAAKAFGINHKGVYPGEDIQSKLPDGCAIPAVDSGSNLYIGMTEDNFRNLSANFNMLLSREKLWQETLTSINNTLQREVK